MKLTEAQRSTNRQRVLMALMVGAEDDLPWSMLPAGQLAEEAGIGPAALKQALLELEEAGDILIPGERFQIRGYPKVVVLLDHRDAMEFLRYLEEIGPDSLDGMWDRDWRDEMWLHRRFSRPGWVDDGKRELQLKARRLRRKRRNTKKAAAG